MLQMATFMNGIEEKSEQVVIATEKRTINKELPNGEVEVYDVDISVPEGVLESVSGYYYIDISHPVVVELCTDEGRLVTDETCVNITRFSITESVLLMARIGIGDELSGCPNEEYYQF